MAYPPATVLGRIGEQARQRPEAIALRRCDGSAVLRYRELMSEIERLATVLVSCGIARGDRVFVISDNGPHTYLSVLACARVGAIAVLVDSGLPPATIDRFAEITRPGAILITPRSRLRVSGLSESLRSIPTFAVEHAVGPASGAPSSAPAVALGADDPLAMIFTSGTTGAPKAVLLSNRTFYAIADILQAEQLSWVNWVVGETTYSPLPATHIGGLWWILNCLMQGGLCLTGGEGAGSIAEILIANDVATTCLVPTLLARLVSELRSTGTPVPPSLRMVGYGGSRAIADDIGFVEAAGVHTAQVYGLSETGCTALCLPTEDGSLAKIAAGAVGRPYPGVEVRLDPDGTLWIKSPANMLGYWDDPARTAATLVDGWVNTGDVLDRRDDGFFYIVGRSSEMIICGGVNIVPDEVDRIAEGVAGVGEAACYEIPDDEFGALVGLAVVPATDLDESGARQLKHAIAARFRQESEPMARPSRIVVVAQIPRTQSGKIIRSSLVTAGG
ncbi:fatty acid--CoA ligase [Mycobacterium sp. TNTM28]|uniref:Fatty acid--CoA ligase n=1 Tax=[Mycobacterium] fortunisiensis TaxID=2600579 RepID=A0ABS6KQF8_9MYCO|nr:fatty acid--CoA ligase FadD10 [[Mycobacterium] fortunisiensis]MBU9765867.1 fatty acid--CoA ligase [[Mycobacterium] fortunisiensis]